MSRPTRASQGLSVQAYGRLASSQSDKTHDWASRALWSERAKEHVKTSGWGVSICQPPKKFLIKSRHPPPGSGGCGVGGVGGSGVGGVGGSGVGVGGVGGSGGCVFNN
jgi:hypothetical protein